MHEDASFDKMQNAVLPQEGLTKKRPWWRSIQAVLWGFLGVRRADAYQEDIHQLHPFQVLATGLIMGILFVIGLMFLVKWVVAK